MITLYGFFTQNTMKALYTLEELGAEYEFKFVNLMKGENRSERFRQLTPMGKVPVLTDENGSLFESGAICRYVATQAGSDLYPQDAAQRAQIDQWLDYMTCHLGRWLNTLFFERVIKQRAKMGEVNPQAVEEAMSFAAQQTGILNDWLAERTYLCGEALSIADLCAYAYLEQSIAIEFPLADYPNVKRWMKAVGSRDSIARAKAKIPV